MAVKVQYPGAGEALRSDLRQLARFARSIGPLVPGVDIKPLVEELQARIEEELDYALEAEAQRAFAAAFRDDPEIVVPDVVAVGDTVLVTEWLESPASLASVIAGRHAGGARPLRATSSCASSSRARHAPACCTRTRTRGTSGSSPPPTAAPERWASSTSARSPGCPTAGCPARWAR